MASYQHIFIIEVIHKNVKFVEEYSIFEMCRKDTLVSIAARKNVAC